MVILQKEKDRTARIIDLTISHLNPKSGQVVFFTIPLELEPEIRHYVFRTKFDIINKENGSFIYLKYEKDYKVMFEINPTITTPSVKLIKSEYEIEELIPNTTTREFFRKLLSHIQTVFEFAKTIFMMIESTSQ